MTDHLPSPQQGIQGAQAFSDWLANGLSNGTLHVGVKLAPERQLSAQFRISRGTVRRVLARFRERGLIEQTVGSGTFVASTLASVSAPTSPAQPGLRTSPAELMEARLLIEPLMPALIVRNATSADFDAMLNALVKSENAATPEEFEHWDGELHRSFALATHNSFFAHILELANRVREEGEWGRLKLKSLTDERRTQYCRQHRAIVEALVHRDRDQAKALMQEHLNQIRSNLFDEN